MTRRCWRRRAPPQELHPRQARSSYYLAFAGYNLVKYLVEDLVLEKDVIIYNLEYEKVLKTKINKKQDYIFLDPPYKSDLLYKAISLILHENILQEGGTIIAETDRIEEFENQIKSLEIDIVDIRKYGRNQFVFLKRE